MLGFQPGGWQKNWDRVLAGVAGRPLVWRQLKVDSETKKDLLMSLTFKIV